MSYFDKFKWLDFFLKVQGEVQDQGKDQPGSQGKPEQDSPQGDPDLPATTLPPSNLDEQGDWMQNA